MCMHFHYEKGRSNLTSRDKKKIEAAKDLNASIIRYDIPLKDYKQGIDYYMSIVDFIADEGLKNFVVLASFGGMTAKQLKLITPPVNDEIFKEITEYSKFVSSHAGSKVQYYQLGNELNNPPISLAIQDSVRLIKAVAEGLEYYQYRVVNPFTDAYSKYNWYEWTKYWLDHAGFYIDIVGIDHYPCSGPLWNPRDWGVLKTATELCNKYGKLVAICETGYSTWLPILHGEMGQVIYVKTAYPEIFKVNSNLEFISWYEIVDELFADPTLPGWFYGILRFDLSKKMAYSYLKKVFEYAEHL